MTSDRARAAGIASTASVLALFGVAGHSVLSGPVIFRFGRSSHGVHIDDLLVLACWALCLAWCWRLWRES